MLDVRPIGIEDYAERCSKPLSALHDKLWVETYAKTHSPGMMVGPLEGQFLRMLAVMTGAPAPTRAVDALNERIRNDCAG